MEWHCAFWMEAWKAEIAEALNPALEKVEKSCYSFLASKISDGIQYFSLWTLQCILAVHSIQDKGVSMQKHISPLSRDLLYREGPAPSHFWERLLDQPKIDWEQCLSPLVGVGKH